MIPTIDTICFTDGNMTYELRFMAGKWMPWDYKTQELIKPEVRYVIIRQKGIITIYPSSNKRNDYKIIPN